MTDAQRIQELLERNSELVMKSTARLQREVSLFCSSKFGTDMKSRGRKLLEETSELCAAMWLDHLNIATLSKEQKECVSREIGDVQIVLFHIAHLFGLDAVECAREKLPLVRKKFESAGEVV